MKKFLTALLIGAFVFGVGVADMNFASAESSDKKISMQAADKAKQKLDGKTMKNPPEPPKDSNGNPLPPPDKDKNSSDGKDRPEPPKDSNGNPLPPPDKNKNSSDGKDRPEPPQNSSSTNNENLERNDNHNGLQNHHDNEDHR